MRSIFPKLTAKQLKAQSQGGGASAAAALQHRDTIDESVYTAANLIAVQPRMADTVDVLRLLLDPSGASGRFAHRFRLHVSTPSNDACAGTSMAMHPPRFVVGEAAPGYSWKAETSSPHG